MLSTCSARTSRTTAMAGQVPDYGWKSQRRSHSLTRPLWNCMCLGVARKHRQRHTIQQETRIWVASKSSDRTFKDHEGHWNLRDHIVQRAAARSSETVQIALRCQRRCLTLLRCCASCVSGRWAPRRRCFYRHGTSQHIYPNLI